MGCCFSWNQQREQEKTFTSVPSIRVSFLYTISENPTEESETLTRNNPITNSS